MTLTRRGSPEPRRRVHSHRRRNRSGAHILTGSPPGNLLTSRRRFPVKFTVTPLGGGRADTARVVDSIVRYLQRAASRPSRRQPAGRGRPAARSGTTPTVARSRAAGSAAPPSLGLAGAVQREDLAAMLAGRNPHTDERLITAQGSAGRRPTLGSGAHTRLAADGEPLFGVADAASVLGVSRREVERMLDVGTTVAAGSLATDAGVNLGGGPPVRPPADGANTLGLLLDLPRDLPLDLPPVR